MELAGGGGGRAMPTEGAGAARTRAALPPSLPSFLPGVYAAAVASRWGRVRAAGGGRR